MGPERMGNVGGRLTENTWPGFVNMRGWMNEVMMLLMFGKAVETWRPCGLRSASRPSCTSISSNDESIHRFLYSRERCQK